MATNFSPCKGSYVLNQFPSIVMFGMKGFHVSANGEIEGHHGPLVKKKCGRKIHRPTTDRLTNGGTDKVSPINPHSSKFLTVYKRHKNARLLHYLPLSPTTKFLTCIIKKYLKRAI